MKMNLIDTDQEEVKYSPKFDGVIGQEKVKQYLGFLIESHNKVTPFPTLLLTGSHGLGKTFISEKIANSLNREFVEVNCETISTGKEFIEEILIKRVAGNKPVTILLDEAHALNKDVTTVLLTLLSPNASHCTSIRHVNLELIFDMRNINVIFATTDAYRIFAPLLNRTERVYFYPYPDDEAYEIVKLYAKGIRLEYFVKPSDVALVARNRARDAYKLAQHILRIVNMSGDGELLTIDLWEELKDILGLYPLGLKQNEVELIKLVGESQPISCSNLAIRMMVNENNIKEEIELRPRELGLIQSTNQGRTLTQAGANYLDNLCP